MSIELVHKGYEIHFEGISYSVPRLKERGLRNDLEAKRVIDKHLRKVARRERAALVNVASAVPAHTLTIEQKDAIIAQYRANKGK